MIFYIDKQHFNKNNMNKRNLYLPVLISMVLIFGVSVTPLYSNSDIQKTQKLKAEDVAKGLIEALKIGAKNSAEKASKVDGFYKNPEIFIPFPPDAIKVKKSLEKAGLSKKVTEFEQSINHAAEEASKKALPIFLEAIKGISFSDAFAILRGSDNAATTYLKDKTADQLRVAFKPVVKEAIAKVQVTKYWEEMAKAYNKINVLSGGKPVKPDLEGYITDKAIDGLFVLIAKEEANIRKDPAARVSDILKNVFGK